MSHSAKENQYARPLLREACLGLQLCTAPPPTAAAGSAAMMSGFAMWMELPVGPRHTVFPGPRDTSHHFPNSVGIQETVLQMSDGFWAQRIALVEFLAESCVTR